jgi:adenosylcobinamide-GDP ribazoletransferase
MMALAGDLIVALMLLTRVPVARFAPPHDPARTARCVWAFPLVGLAAGAVGGGVYGACHRYLPPLLDAGWTVAAMLLVTGALHEDGLADAVDGFGGGKTRAEKLAIMRDSRVGSYGALAVMVCVAIRIAAMSTLAEPGMVTKALILAGMLGRAAMLVLVLALDPARADGLASGLGSRGRWPVAVAFGIAAAACLLVMPAVPAMAIMAAAAIVGIGMANLARTQIGGYTGDVLGACEAISECAILTMVVGATRVGV